MSKIETLIRKFGVAVEGCSNFQHTALSQGFDNLFEDQAICFGDVHEDAAYPEVLLIKPSAFAPQDQTARGVNTKGSKGHSYPKLLARLGNVFVSKFEFKSA